MMNSKILTGDAIDGHPDDGWQPFTGRGDLIPSGPWVSIHKHPTLSLNEAAYEALGKPAAVELLFDAERRRVGLRPVDPGVEWSYPLRLMGRNTYVVSCGAFRRRYGIVAGPARRYPAMMRDGVLAFDLDGPAAGVGWR